MVTRLEKAKSLRDAFPSEVRDLSRWIKDNIDEIGAVTDLTLSNVERERPAGDFSVDLIAEDDRGGVVVIENQLGKSDHDHLGKLLTYLTAYDAQVAIWIVENPRTEHVNAIAWLNQSSSADFYLIKIEAVRIGGSDYAPLMTLIVGPSEESKRIETEKEEIKLRHSERRLFWEGLLEVANQKTDLHSGRSPTKDGWIGAGSGISGLNFNYVIRQHDAQVELWIGRGAERVEENKKIFDELYEHKAEIEKTFGNPLEWERLDQKDGCRIRARSNIGGYRDVEKRDEIYTWLTDKMVLLEKALKPVLPLIRALR